MIFNNYRGRAKGKVVYLTLDDGPSNDFSKKVDFLKERNIPAIFFSQGNFMEKKTRDIIDSIKKGFVIANHSYNHPYFSNISLKEAITQIRSTEEIIESLYRDSEIERDFKLFRFPYGDKGKRKSEEHYNSLNNILMGEGFQNLNYTVSYPDFRKKYLNDMDLHWTLDTEDWTVPSLRRVFKGLKNRHSRGGGHLYDLSSVDIIVLHDHDKSTHLFYPTIERMLEMGVEFQLPLSPTNRF